MNSRTIADAHALQRLVLDRRVRHQEAGVRLLRDEALRNRGEHVFRLESLDRIEHQRGILDRLAMDSRAIPGVLVRDAAVHQDAFGRQQIDDVVSRRRPFAGRRGLFANRARRQIGRHGNAGPVARTARHARGVVRIARLAAPRSVLKIGLGNYVSRLVGTAATMLP